MKASTRRQLKHDRFVDTVVTFWKSFGKWVAPRKMLLAVLAAAVVIGFLSYLGYSLYGQSKTKEAWVALEKARSNFEDNDVDPNYRQLASNYAGTQAEPWILYYWALHELRTTDSPDGKEPEKIKQARKAVVIVLENLRQRFPKHPVSERSAILLGQQYADMFEWATAARYYREVTNSKSDVVDRYLKSEAKFWLAYSLEAQGEVQQAQIFYSDLEGLETSRWGDLAKYRLGRLHAAGN